MSDPTTPLPPPLSPPATPSSTPTLTPTPIVPPTTLPPKTKPPPIPLTGFRVALSHTGIPHSVLTWKPRLPSRNWSIFLTVVTTVSYIYYDDRRQARKIRQEYIDRVKHLAGEPMKGSLDLPRKVKVMAGRWPGDDEPDRTLLYFKKYVKPYLVAAAVDYEPLPAPLPGSITRQIHAQILKKRRQALNLEPPTELIQFPTSLSPAEIAAREVEEGVIVVGRASLKEYLEGRRRGWGGGVGEWDWEKDIEKKIAFDGVFDEKVDVGSGSETGDALGEVDTPIVTAPTTPASSLSGLSFLSRPSPPTPSSFSPDSPSQSIPERYHATPATLPPHPPLLLVPFTSYLGFKQFPYMIYSFFTEHLRVRSGAEAAIAIIEGPTRPFSETDLSFDIPSEAYYPKWYRDTVDRTETARKDYYDKLKERLKDARAFANGEREMTKVEEKNQKVTTELDLREERRKRELRWMGTEDGFDIVKPESPIAWDQKWEGWLSVYDIGKAKRSEGFGKESMA